MKKEEGPESEPDEPPSRFREALLDARLDYIGGREREGATTEEAGEEWEQGMSEEAKSVSGAGQDSPDFGEVFAAVRRVIGARGVRVAGESLITYQEGDLEFSRTALNEYEVRSAGRVVFRSQHTGALSSAHVFEPGDWVEEVRRVDGEIRRDGRK